MNVIIQNVCIYLQWVMGNGYQRHNFGTRGWIYEYLIPNCCFPITIRLIVFILPIQPVTSNY